MQFSDALIDTFIVAADELRYHVKKENWLWTSNYLREYVRARYHFKFSNSQSPEILREVVRRRPDLGVWIKLKPLKEK